MRDLFAVQNVTFRYEKSIAALRGTSLNIRQGQRVALIGANGSGKSTLLRLLDGLYFPHEGVVTFEGEPLTPRTFENEKFRFGFRRRVGMVFQNPDVQLFCPTVFDEVAFAPLQLEWSHDEVIAAAGRALATMGVEHLKDRVPHRLSGGEKKRVAIASVLVLDPDVLLLDEPTSGLDPRSQSQVIDLLNTHYADERKTVVAATHDLATLEEVADVCLVMNEGQVVATGTPREVLDNQALLQHTGLIHAHRHRHGSLLHSHAHSHGHKHEL